jgi:uncharacterized protein YndB with AHSA1/START domain
MQQVEVNRTVDGPPARAWEIYTDHAGWKAWAGLTHSSVDREGTGHRNGAGAIRCLGSYGVNAWEEVLEFEPPVRMTYRVLKGGLPMKNHWAEVLFEPDGAGTKVIWRCRFDSRVPGLGWLMRLYIHRFFRSALEGFDAHLRRI